jgi:hypothetical protein
MYENEYRKIYYATTHNISSRSCCTPDNFDMFFGHTFIVILDILKIFCSNKYQIITDLLNYLDPIKS